MTTRYVFAVGIAGMAALAAWLMTQRRNEGPLDIDDDAAADIIRRFHPALHAVWVGSRSQLSAF